MAAVGECSLPAPWRPVSLTHVEYPAGDFSGQLLAYLSLGPIFIIVGFVTLIIFKRELHTISFLGGLAFNEGVNWLIKNVIREPRPCEEAHSTVTTKYGMPSSHSQFMWFFSVYSFLFLYLRMHQTNNARFLDLLWRHVLSICLVTVALLVSYSRYGAIVCLMLSYSPVAFNSQQTCHSLSCISDLILDNCIVQVGALQKLLCCHETLQISKGATCVVLHRSISKSQDQLSLYQFPIGSIATLYPHCLALFPALIMKALHHALAHQHLQHVDCYS
ncbi:dolichyldiphosphatase 1 isoform X1 [Rissa tridactyla]|uniref:dolichyldiphosphatase 1 isoform X1 n=1 Tax=Rissa tridactyla TaxID=75485 RepID=UPI0023BAE2DF|nr:dolichyldiphosphatase 1 isoform X1 [Rissa tridactyla]